MKIACGFTIPITLYGLPPSPEDHLKAMEIVGEAGFSAMELELTDELLDAHRRDLGKMKKILKDQNMTVPAVMAVEEHMFSLDPAIKSKAIEDFDGLTDLIVELECPIVSICGYMPPEIRAKDTALYVGGPPTAVTVSDDFSWPVFWDNAVDLVSQLADISESKGLSLIMETRANDLFSSTDALINLLREASDKLVLQGKAAHTGLILDVAHVHAGKEYLGLVIPKLDKLIKLVHLSDNDGTQAFHRVPGEGNIDFEAIFAGLARTGYDDYIVVDISGVPNVVDGAIKTGKYFQSLIDQL